MLKYLEDYDLPEYKKQLEERKKELIEQHDKLKKFEEDLESLKKELKENLDNDNQYEALRACEEIIKICEEKNKTQLVEGYSETLNTIKKNIRELEKSKEKEQDQNKFNEFKKIIIALSEKGMKLVSNNEFKPSLDIYNEIVEKLEDYKK